MNFKEIIIRFCDNHRKNEYQLKKFLIDDGKKHPFAIICPGGGYGFVSSSNEGYPFAKELNKRGYHAFVVYYRVKEKALYPAPFDDLEKGINEVFSNAEKWNLDTSSWSLWGSSAGGHLVASFCTDKRNVPMPNALVLIYPVITMGKLTHEGSRDNLLGENPSEEIINKFSVEKQINANYPPTYLWCGTADKTVNTENSKMMDSELSNNGVMHKLDIYDGIGHGVGLGKGIDWFEHAVEFWEDTMQAD